MIFAGSIMDITWSQCGMELLCCSLDGTVAYLQFSSKEMGTPLSQVELVKLHRDTYGQSLLCEEDAAAITIGGVSARELEGKSNGPSAGLLAESAEMLVLQREQRRKEEEAAANAATDQGDNREKAAVQIPRGPNEQIEVRVDGGRRRITPKFLGDLHGDTEPADEESVGVSNTAVVSAASAAGGSSTAASTVTAEAMDVSHSDLRPAEGVAKIADSASADKSATQSSAAKEVFETQDSSKKLCTPSTPRKRGRPRKEKAKEKEKEKEKEATTKARRSRVLSSSPSSRSASCASSHGENEADDSSTSNGDTSSTESAASSAAASSSSSATEAASMPDDKKKKMKKEQKRQKAKAHRRLIIDSDTDKEEEGEADRKKEKNKKAQKKKTSAKKLEVKARREKRDKVEPSAAMGERDRPEPLLAEVTALPTAQASLGLGGDRSVQVDSIEVRSRSGAPMRLHRLSVWNVRLNQRTAEVLLPYRPVALATTKEHVCLCDERGRLHIWSAACTRLCPPLRLNAGCVSMTTTGNRLLLVTRDCAAHLWSLAPSIRLLHRVSFGNLVSSSSSYRSCQLSADDTIVISLTDGSAFAFSPQVNVWLELADTADSVRQLSRLLYKDNYTSGPLALATSTAAAVGQNSLFLASTPAGTETPVRQTALEDFFESQLASALLLRSPEEARHWLLCYARHIISTGREEKVRKLCEDLLGPAHPDSTSHSAWEDNILGLRKRTLLHEILPSFGLNLKLQRLFSEIKDQLDVLESS